MHVTLIGLKLSTIYKNFSTNHDFVSTKIFFKSLINGKELQPELEQQFVISAPALGGHLISAPWLWLWLRLYNTGKYPEIPTPTPS
jgi:hypothetical protein